MATKEGKNRQPGITKIADLINPTAPGTYSVALIVDDLLHKPKKFVNQWIQHYKPAIVVSNLNIGDKVVNKKTLLDTTAHVIWEVHRIVIIDYLGNLQDCVEVALRMDKKYQYYSSNDRDCSLDSFRRVKLERYEIR